MRYAISDIEDQILATLTRETLTGTISSSGVNITGVNTLFTTELSVGNVIVAPTDETTPLQEQAGTNLLTVATITDPTHMTVSVAPSSALSGDKFSLRFPDSTSFECNTYAGDLSSNLFMLPEFQEGLIKRLPFVFVQYLGRTTAAKDHTSSLQYYEHILTFRLYVGAKSLRTGQEAARGAYDLLAIVYDRLHGKVPYMSSGQVFPNLPALEGVPITTSQFNPLTVLAETGGADEKLVVNLPSIKVYQTDFRLKLSA